jgi:8-oxo-dGTP pyrophosphatase MutT (NUDIX family)
VELITLRDAAERWGYSERTLHLLVRQNGLVRYRRPGDRRTWLDQEALEAILQPRPKSESSRPTPEHPHLVAAIIPNGDKVLMTVRRFNDNSVWSWPSGHVEPGETPEAAVVRELKEELVAGEPAVMRHLGTVETTDDVSRWWGRKFTNGYRMDHFLVTVDPGDVTLIDHEELLRADWRDLDQVAEATASLPGDLAQAAVRFAREATTPTPAQNLPAAERRSPPHRAPAARREPSEREVT